MGRYTNIYCIVLYCIQYKYIAGMLRVALLYINVIAVVILL